VLAESHISIHTWPERNFAALDVFMCGACDPHKVIPFLEAAFHPAEIMLDEQRRGIVS
jgi:S-adenosylmethionine decarboxylase